ncbi:EamA family transporter [Legionella oakridgensis]|uniref:Transporter family transporter protein n=2 Tax=Legionella oakridgensis TaxID=29423 RepID=A0A0W0X0C7_9GAMM|nr:EamA family transporter [Legionella oakridgensis]AHE67146.1 putative membrane protein [Legionella oakridgensis ATCC 33761 = DSM 21215]ETO93117.1 putative membrane protein [Legionella oakridgensis RV-2-2007]KTD38047.1 transporter family transporter protein [Legionella oakridgensis]STY20231.1 bacterial/Archaeal transporter family protein [Legionella longbeachae]
MTISAWYLPSFVSLFLYGVWGYWGAKASSLIQPLSTVFYSSLGVLVAGFIALFLLGFKPELSMKGGAYGLLNGLANGIGCIFFIIALRKGPAMPVILITSMYPFITLLFCVLFLKQGVTWKQGIGMLFAIMALIFLSLE